MTLLFDLSEPPSLPVVGEAAHFPINRIFCVGQNYEAHAREMGSTADRKDPIYFTKSALAFCPSGTTIPYPPGTGNCHYEMELVVAIGAEGFRVTPEQATSLVLGYACGLDMTRRDLQHAAKDRGRPWDTAKDFENSAVLAPITRTEAFGPLGEQRIALTQNGEIRQDSRLSEMVWSVPEILANLSHLYHLQPGDLLFTGTPSGIGPIATGDRLVGTIDGLTPVELSIGDAE
ncbi:MAG: fumarylacetoacetate hydrolase family protein [Novosphingobium sp.]|nr:fumarylacetoacetate hydrolase family protein [Novosphingobium sp.]